jgi:hypothetical protein
MTPSDLVGQYFHVTNGNTPAEIVIAFRGDTDPANAGTVSIRTIGLEEAEVISDALRWVSMEARQYLMSLPRKGHHVMCSPNCAFDHVKGEFRG